MTALLIFLAACAAGVGLLEAGHRVEQRTRDGQADWEAHVEAALFVANPARALRVVR